MRLERETKTKISIPGKGQEGNIVVTGRERKGLVAACNRSAMDLKSVSYTIHKIYLLLKETCVKYF